MLALYLSVIEDKVEKLKFEDLYNTYKNLMFHIAYDVLKNNEDAEDAASEAFMRIAKKFTKISKISCPQTKSFVVIIVKNVAITMLNKSKKTSVVSLYEVDGVLCDDTDVEEEVFNQFDILDIKDKINNLPEIYFDVMTLFYSSDFSINEIAQMLDLKAETVKKRLQRAKLMLINELKGRDN